jgi:hypothetical protein
METIRRTNQKLRFLRKDLAALEYIFSLKSYVTKQDIEDYSWHFKTTPEVIKRLAGSKYNPNLEDFKIP